MKFVFDTQDEQDVLQEMSRNQRRAEYMAQVCVQQGKSKQAASWVKSAHRITTQIILVEQAFQHKN